MAKFEYSGVNEAIDALNNEPFDCTCSVCGKQFQATEEQLSKPTVICPHCGAKLEEV